MAHVAQLELVQETPFRWRIEQHGEMRVAGRVFASSALLSDIATDEAHSPGGERRHASRNRRGLLRHA
jgi:hypothetical protein